MKLSTSWLLASALVLSFGACDSGGTTPVEEEGTNPLLDPGASAGKADTQYYNPDGIEVEIDLEADIEASSYQKATGPAILGQYAMTYFRNKGSLYIESLAEQATSRNRVEWLVDGEWIAAGDAGAVEDAKKTHFRIRGINAVLLHRYAEGVEVGDTFEAPVPVAPFSIFADAGKTCADDDGHIGVSQSVYWYVWNPDKAGCTARLQQMKLTVSKLLPVTVTYPEYDQLVADGQVTMVVLFGQIGDGPIDDREAGVRNMKRFGTWLLQADFKEIENPPVGRRFEKIVGEAVVQIDLYGPTDFSGLGDYANLPNLQRAISEHEIVAYDGHSMLGASDFWSRPTYPDFYQIYLYGGCLGYEYYVAPILAGKDGDWGKVDIMSSTVEVSAPANDYAGPFLGKLLVALGNGYRVSWKDILGAVRSRVGDSTFGMSGVRENCFAPGGGSLCGGVDPVVNPDVHTWDASPALDIPDNDENGVSSTLDVEDDLAIDTLSVHLDIAHSYVGDLYVVLAKDGVEAVVWNRDGANGRDLDETVRVDGFYGMSTRGTWTLTVSDRAGQDVGVLRSWSLSATAK
ncbi:MAG: hypothetical protein EP329_10745 [Deltaproteobacteria bacterium]|nr:MAG: hypothetical protein EP329_10745 [Deltaproteobacteria bacterium]